MTVRISEFCTTQDPTCIFQSQARWLNRIQVAMLDLIHGRDLAEVDEIEGRLFHFFCNILNYIMNSKQTIKWPKFKNRYFKHWVLENFVRGQRAIGNTTIMRFVISRAGLQASFQIWDVQGFLKHFAELGSYGTYTYGKLFICLLCKKQNILLLQGKYRGLFNFSFH